MRINKLFVAISAFLFAIPITGNFSLMAQEEVYKLSLEDVTRLALENNFDIQLARFDAKIARTNEGVAESIYDTMFKAEVEYRNNQKATTSTLAGTKNIDNDYNIGLSKKLPIGATLSMNMTNNRNWTNSPYASFNPAHDSSLGMTVEQDLGQNFFGIQDRNTVTITRMDIENSDYLSLDRIEQSIADVQKAYWGLVLAMQRLQIEDELLQQAKRLFDIQTEKLQDGLSEAPEVYAAEANYKTRINGLLLARNEVETRNNTLRFLLNITDEKAKILPADVLSVPNRKEELKDSLKKAFDSRRDYRRVLLDIRSKKLKLSMKKNSLWPQISLTATMTRNGLGDHFKQAITNISDENNPEIYAGIQFSIPLENTKARAEKSAAELEKAKALVSLKLVERTIAMEIVDQVRTCNILRQVAVNNQKVVNLQKRKLEEEEKRFYRGRSNTDTIIRFQEDLLSSRLQAAQSMFDYHAALIDLSQKEGALLGTYWEHNAGDQLCD